MVPDPQPLRTAEGETSTSSAVQIFRPGAMATGEYLSEGREPTAGWVPTNVARGSRAQRGLAPPRLSCSPSAHAASQQHARRAVRAVIISHNLATSDGSFLRAYRYSRRRSHACGMLVVFGRAVSAHRSMGMLKGAGDDERYDGAMPPPRSCPCARGRHRTECLNASKIFVFEGSYGSREVNTALTANHRPS